MTPREQYEAMLDELPDKEKARLLSHVPFARLLEEFDPVAFRCGLNDFQACCEKCGDEFWTDGPDDEAICGECAKRIAAEEEGDN